MALSTKPIAKPIERPLSPHLQVYRFTWTMAMSILHRITGAALYAGTILIALWLMAAASGPLAFGWAQTFAGSWLGLLVLFGYTWALLHHMLGGLRHFVWDLGKGYGLAARMNLAKFGLIGSAVLTVLLWLIVLVWK
jgi:succinate dehydrogenase / fumarate reductase, cytochrome b subunit